MERVYLDYAASTPVDPRVEKAMKPYFGKIFANPHSLHQFGQEASRAVFEARRKIAKSIGADYKEIIFTGSATEANNLAIRGALRAFRVQHLAVSKKNKKSLHPTPYTLHPRIITSAIEHESVLETCRDLEREGLAEIIYIPVDREGIVDLKKLKAALNERTVLVSIMHANNEIGTIQPISEISNLIKQFKTLNPKPYSLYPLFHTDAVQSFQYLDCNVDNLGVDLMTLSAHKIYGPKGIGALYVRGFRVQGLGFSERKTKPTLNAIPYTLHPIITGSGQEFGLRSGTDNVPYIVGFGEAVEIVDRARGKESRRVEKLRDYFWEKLRKIKVVPRRSSGNNKKLVGEPACPALAVVEPLQLNGSLKQRLPNNLNIYFPGHSAQELLIRLDMAGIATSPGAACSARVSEVSYVLEALGFPEKRAGGSLRFSLGRQTTKNDLDYALGKIKKSML